MAASFGVEFDEVDFIVEEELPSFLNSVLDRTENTVTSASQNVDEINTCISVVDQAISLLQLILMDGVIETDWEQWQGLLECFRNILKTLHELSRELLQRPTTLTVQPCDIRHERRPGRPSFYIQPEVLEELLAIGFTQEKIAQHYCVSRWTIGRRIQEYNIQPPREFSNLSNEEIDEVIQDYKNRHGNTTGQVLIMGYLRSCNIHLPRRRVRESLARIDPANVALRWGATVYRRTYQVPWANSLWHIDGHHSLIRWGIVIHGCIDGFSRRVMYLHASSNNYSSTVLSLFLDAIDEDGGIWPSRIRVDRGVENVLVCEAMVDARGEGRASFIAGPSTHNQRIERLWRDVFRTVSHFFYYIFYALEDAAILNTTNQLHMFALHLVFLPRINVALHEFKEGYNHHKIRTMNNWSPYQAWLNSILNPANPLLTGQPDPLPDSAEFYGYDPQGPNPFEESNNDVVVPPITVENADHLRTAVLNSIDPLRNSNEMGIDIYEEAINILNTLTEIPG